MRGTLPRCGHPRHVQSTLRTSFSILTSLTWEKIISPLFRTATGTRLAHVPFLVRYWNFCTHYDMATNPSPKNSPSTQTLVATDLFRLHEPLRNANRIWRTSTSFHEQIQYEGRHLVLSRSSFAIKACRCVLSICGATIWLREALPVFVSY